MEINIKKLSYILIPLIFLATVAIYQIWLKSWSIEGVWVSGPNDGLGLMPTKKEFIAEFGEKQFKFQNIVRPIKGYQYEIDNQLVIMHAEKRLIKIRIIDDDTIRFNEGSHGVGLRVYHRK